MDGDCTLTIGVDIPLSTQHSSRQNHWPGTSGVKEQ